MTRTTKLITALGLCLVLMLGAVATVCTVSAQGSIKDWPPLIIRYSITGQYYAIGDEKAPVATKEILVTYRGLNDWKREIVAAPTVDVGDHSFSEVGSFIEVKNGTVTDYDATASYTEVEDLEPDTYMSPELRLAPLPFEKMVEKYDGDPVNGFHRGAVVLEDRVRRKSPRMVFRNRRRGLHLRRGQAGHPLGDPWPGHHRDHHRRRAGTCGLVTSCAV